VTGRLESVGGAGGGIVVSETTVGDLDEPTGRAVDVAISLVLFKEELAVLNRVAAVVVGADSVVVDANSNSTMSLCTLGSLISGIWSNCLESPNDSPLVTSGFGFLGLLLGSKLEFEAARFKTVEEVVTASRSVFNVPLGGDKEILAT